MRSIFLVFFFTIFVHSFLSSQNPLPENILQEVSSKYQINQQLINEASVASDYQAHNGNFRSIWLRQNYKGFSLRNADLFLVLNAKNELVYSTSSFVNNPELIDENAANSLEVAFILKQHLSPYSKSTQVEIKSVKEKSKNKLEYTIQGFNSTIIRELIYVVEEGKLLYVTALRFTGKDGLMRELIVHNASGAILENNILTLQCNDESHLNKKNNHAYIPENTESSQVLALDGSGYRVFPYPYESPLNGPRVLLSNPADENASPFGWHDSNGLIGADETQTIGNNVMAYDDQDDDDFPDDYTEGGIGLQFDFPLFSAPSASPLESRDAALTNLFYTNNRLHDVLWHYGFDEASGNFQYVNYSGGFGDFDGVEAQAFDGGGFNNANFGTPPDGESPRMQMYLWAFNTSNEYLSIQSPSNIAGSYLSAVATFGPNTTPSPIIAPLVLVNDGSFNPTLGCTMPENDLFNKIALIDRGDCDFVVKVLNAEFAGAIAVIVINNTSEAPFSMGGNDPSITIPSILISMEDGQVFKNAIAQGQVIARISIDNPTPYFDSSFDNGIIAHEYGHGVSNRLTGGPLNTDCLRNEEQMGEGWSDYITLMMTLTSANFANEARGIGNYVRGNSISGPGIRPFPYSRDVTINPVTYNYITELSIPHGLGSVWCSMLWDMTWDLIDIYGFDSDIINGNGGNNIAFQLVMDGMRLQPCSPGFIDGRDAILLADQLNNNGANRCLIWTAFARRGLGYLADQGSSENAFDGFQDFIVPPNCSQADFAFFSRSSPAACKGDAIVYTDLSDPPAASRIWTFEGGVPATSTDSIVSVIYNQSGLKETILSVVNGDGSDDFSSSVSISNPPSVNIVKGDAAPGIDNGFVSITPLGGTPPYTTAWSQFPGINDLTITSLAPGTYQFSLIDGAGCRVDTSITIDLISSIASISNTELHVFPNPFEGSVHVNVENSAQIVEIALYDVSGRIIVLKAVNSSSTQINTEFISSGTYILQVQLNDGKLVQQILVK